MIEYERPNIKCIDQFASERAAIYHGDSVEILRAMPEASAHYMIFSPPFDSLYTYSNSERDLGNCKNREEFLEHYRFIAPQLFRILQPGRLMSFHCMNLPATKERDGFIGVHDFRGDLIREHLGEDALGMYRAIASFRARADLAEDLGNPKRALKLREASNVLEEDLRTHPGITGAIFHSEVCIWKDPVTAMQRTKAIGLLYKQLRKDSCISRQGIADYLVTMRKPGVNAERVTKTFDGFPVSKWQQWASPVWNDIDADEVWNEKRNITDALERTPVKEWAIEDIYPTESWLDINPSDTLQRESAREDRDERHICPLQLQVIERGIELWTNPGDIVLSPYAGIGSEGFVALRSGRRFVGVELKKSYFEQAKRNLMAAEEMKEQKTLEFTEANGD